MVKFSSSSIKLVVKASQHHGHLIKVCPCLPLPNQSYITHLGGPLPIGEPQYQLIDVYTRGHQPTMSVVSVPTNVFIFTLKDQIPPSVKYIHCKLFNAAGDRQEHVIECSATRHTAS